MWLGFAEDEKGRQENRKIDFPAVLVILLHQSNSVSWYSGYPWATRLAAAAAIAPTISSKKVWQ